MRPIKCEPIYIESVWAGSRLTKIRHLDYKNIGICREICAYKGSQNKILNPEYHGLTFKELIEDHHHELFGDSKDTQLIRVAYIDALEDYRFKFTQTIRRQRKSETSVKMNLGIFLTVIPVQRSLSELRLRIKMFCLKLQFKEP